MEITFRHVIEFRVTPEVAAAVKHFFAHALITGDKLMTAVQDLGASVDGLADDFTTKGIPLFDAVVTELGELSDALKAAVDAGSVASLAPIKDRVDTLRSTLATKFAELAAKASAVDITPETPVPGSTPQPPVPPVEPPAPPVEPPAPPVEPPAPPVDATPPAPPADTPL